MSTAAGLALLSLITQIEAAGHTRVLLLDNCPDDLKGFYTPTHNRIGLCPEPQQRWRVDQHLAARDDAPVAALPED